MSDNLTAIYVEPHQCPSYQSILLTQGPILTIFEKKCWELVILKISVFLSRPFWFVFPKKKYSFIPMKISSNLYGRMDGSKFWWFPWFPENSLLFVMLRYTVYVLNVLFRPFYSKFIFFSPLLFGVHSWLFVLSYLTYIAFFTLCQRNVCCTLLGL